MVIELAGIIVTVVVSLVVCVGAAVWAATEPREPEPWDRPREENR